MYFTDPLISWPVLPPLRDFSSHRLLCQVHIWLGCAIHPDGFFFLLGLWLLRFNVLFPLILSCRDVLLWLLLSRSCFVVCGTTGYTWGIGALVLNISSSSSLSPICILRILISWIIIFFMFYPQNTLLCLSSRHEDRSWLNPFTYSSSIQVGMWPPTEKETQQIPTVLRNSPLCFSTSRKIRCIECQALCFSPNTLRASSFLTCWRKAANLSRSSSWPWSQTALGFIPYSVGSGRLLYFWVWVSSFVKWEHQFLYYWVWGRVKWVHV